MPRNPGTGQYSKPIPDAVPNTTIASAPYNTNVDDVVVDLNLPRPVVAGGTGATSAAGARSNLQAEMAGQQVVNYSAQIWENGSFWSPPGAAGAQNGTSYFVGTAILVGGSQDNLALLAYDHAAGIWWSKQKSSGIWTAWLRADQAALDNSNTKVGKGGDTMTGVLILAGDPTVPMHAATKQYADAKVAKTGDTMTGALNINAGPALPTTSGTLNISYYNLAFIARPASDGNFPAVFQNAAGVNVGNINTTSVSTFYNTSSDATLKEDLKSFDASVIVDATNVYDFAWRSTKERSVGVVAQEAKNIYPAAFTQQDERWFVDYSKYVPVLLAAVKALRARVAQLEAGLAAKPA